MKLLLAFTFLIVAIAFLALQVNTEAHHRCGHGNQPPCLTPTPTQTAVSGGFVWSQFGVWGYNVTHPSGVTNIEFWTYNNGTNELVWYQNEGLAPYCAFGNADSQCDQIALADGVYRVEALAHANDGAADIRSHTTAVGSSGTPTPTPVFTVTPTPTVPAQPTATPTPIPCTQVQQLVLVSSQTYNNYCVSNTSGHCVIGIGVSQVTISNSTIGPCEGRGVSIANSVNVTIRDSSISVNKANPGPDHACPAIDVYNNIYVLNSDAVTILRNIVSRGEDNIHLRQTRNSVVDGNTIRDPLGESCYRQTQIQIEDYPPREHPDRTPDLDAYLSYNNQVINNTVACSYAAGCRSTDSINFIGTKDSLIQNNIVRGGVLDYGCSYLADLGNYNLTFRSNRSTFSANCAFGIADGGPHWLENNTAENCQNNISYTQACIYVWNPYSSDPITYWQYGPDCGPATVTGNTVVGVPDSWLQFWYGGGCEPLTQSGNSWQIQPPATGDGGLLVEKTY